MRCSSVLLPDPDSPGEREHPAPVEAEGDTPQHGRVGAGVGLGHIRQVEQHQHPSAHPNVSRAARMESARVALSPPRGR